MDNLVRERYLPFWVLLGAALGVCIGLFNPYIASLLQPVGEIYIRLMEVVVLPYLIASLILGLGRLTPATARRLLGNSWVAYLILWFTAFAVISVAAATAPLVTVTPVVNFASMSDPNHFGSSLVDLVIPDNLFAALSGNYIPSVVMIAIIFGVAIQHIGEKDSFLEFLDVTHKACIKIWNWVVYMAPIGVCGLLGSTISGIDPDELEELSLYIIVVVASGILLAFWVLPMMLTSFTRLGYWEVLSALKNAFLIAFVTTLSVAALPLLQSAVTRLVTSNRVGDDTEEQREVIQTTLSVSYPLAQVGNFFILVFLLYASFYFFVPIAGPQALSLPGMTLISGIGSPTSSIGAVSFLASWLNMPSLATDLYVETMTITRYAQILASVSAFAFITILVVFKFYGKATFRAHRFLVTLAVSIVCLIGIWAMGRYGGTHIPLHSETNYQAMGLPAAVQSLSDANLKSRLGSHGGQAKIDESSNTPDQTSDGLSRIQSNGEIRIGFNPKVLPFSYMNRAGRLVGYDVELMYRFARDMNVELRFIPYNWQTLQADLEASRFDIAIGGIYITEGRLEAITASNPYYENPIALIVRSSQVQDFSSRDRINRIENLEIAVFDDPVLLPLAKRSFPGAKIKVLPNYDNLAEQASVDAALWTIEQARAWAISNTGYKAVVPKDLATRFLFGYLMPKQSLALADYMNYWLELQKASGVLADMEKRWIDPAASSSSLGEPQSAR
ncbi:MAG: cation:dicarboxylase symporter family transporter [Pseudomonadota bacterium]